MAPVLPAAEGARRGCTRVCAGKPASSYAAKVEYRYAGGYSTFARFFEEFPVVATDGRAEEPCLPFSGQWFSCRREAPACPICRYDSVSLRRPSLLQGQQPGHFGRDK